MKPICLLILISFPAILEAQKNKWEISLQIQPEATFHKDSYRLPTEQKSKTSFNTGVASLLQYNLNKRLFINAGAGFISRKISAENFLDQSALPPPKQSFTQELVTSKFVRYRTLFLPINVGFNVVAKEKLTAFFTTGFSGNYLLNAYYNANFTRYQGTYTKSYWQGYSVNIGMGGDYQIMKKISLTTTLSYSLVNKVHADSFLPDREGGGLKLTHRYLKLGVGFKMPL